MSEKTTKRWPIGAMNILFPPGILKFTNNKKPEQENN